MSEIKENETKQQTDNKLITFLKSKFLKQTLAVTIGVFIGTYGSLSLFALTHKPPKRVPAPYMQKHFNQGDFHKMNHNDKAHGEIRPNQEGKYPEGKMREYKKGQKDFSKGVPKPTFAPEKQ